MDDALHTLLHELPARRPASRLAPHARLIRELRRRGRSYREIVEILAQRCDVHVGLHTLYNFVQVRARKRASSSSTHARQPVAMRLHPQSPVSTHQRSQPPDVPPPKEFVFDENEPLRLVAKGKSGRT
jgi:hypothetical protein